LKATNLHLSIKTLRNGTKYGTHNCNRSSEDDYEFNEFKREIFEKIVKKLQNGKASGADNIPSEL